MDSSRLLATKLNLPVGQPGLLPRPELMARIATALRGADGGYGCRLTLVSAPAGYGKTTLLAEWARTSEEEVAWLSLDEGDNDVARFLAYLLAAIERRVPEIGEGALALLGTNRAVPGEQFLTSLINDVAALPEAKGVVLVLDDYQALTNPAVHELVTFLLAHLPCQLHLMIATRADPPLSLARLRARRQMVEIRQADLQFSAAQAATLLNEVAGLGLSPAEVTALHQRSEGWVSGLQMAALALRDAVGRPGERAARVEAFTGSQRYILDYLLEEVLQQQPEAIRDFLLQTSVLPQLSAALCAEVVEQEEPGYLLADGHHLPHAQAVLEYLEAANLFIVPLDSERRWYRYHQLFAELLVRRLQQVKPEQAMRVQRRASEWYERRGMVEMAIEQALAARAYARAAYLLEDTAESMLMRSEIGTLLRLLEAMPEEMVQERPRLRAYCGGARLLMGEPLERVRPLLSEAEEETAPTAPGVDAELGAFRALLAMLQGDVGGSERHSRRALAELPSSSHFLRGLVAENLGFVAVLRGNLEGAVEAFAEAIRLARESGNRLVTVGALCNVAGLHLTRGQLRRAEQLYREALAVARDRHGRPLPIAGKALFGLGDLYREWNRLEEAAAYLEEAMILFRQYGEIGLIFAGTSLARVRLAQGEVAAAEALLQDAEAQAAQMDSTQMDDLLVHIYRVIAWLLQGEVEKAAQRAGSAFQGVPVAAPQFREAVDGTLARLRLAEGEAIEALALLRPLLATVAEKGQRGSEIKLSVPLALALEAQGEREEALAALARALELARPEGYMRAFLDEGAMRYGREALPRLLYVASERGVESAYAGQLLAALAEGQPIPDSPVEARARAGTLIEPLSEREVEVLQLIAAGLSNREIGERLVIALSTVKGHTSNIYGKLGVSKRTEAVARARTLGLIG